MEHEITGHARKAYKIAKNPALPFWKKVKEILFEILIIVFAISLAAYLERRREQNHEQSQVKTFLLGLKIDLQSDVKEMGTDRQSFVDGSRAFSYFARLKKPSELSKDSARLYSTRINSTATLIPNSGRYEGFKSSGKIGSIENTSLQNDILDLYQENIPSLLTATAVYNDRKMMLISYLLDAKKTNPDGSSNLSALIFADKVKNIYSSLINVDEITGRYDTIVHKSQRIIAAIDKEYE